MRTLKIDREMDCDVCRCSTFAVWSRLKFCISRDTSICVGITTLADFQFYIIFQSTRRGTVCRSTLYKRMGVDLAWDTGRILVEIGSFPSCAARLAQSVEHETLNLRVVGSSPTLGATFFCTLH